MNERCIAPTEIEAGDLVAYLEGAAPSRVGRHIGRCPACAEELEALRQTDALFRQALAQAESKWVETSGEIGTAVGPEQLKSRHWFDWLNRAFQGSAWRPAAVATAIILLLMGLQQSHRWKHNL